MLKSADFHNLLITMNPCCRYRRIREIYTACQDNVSKLLGAVKYQGWVELRNEVDSMTENWLGT